LEDEFGEDLPVEFHFDEMDLSDELQMAQRDAIYAKVMTTNEMRDRVDLSAAGVDPITGKTTDELLKAWGETPTGNGLYGGMGMGGFGGGGFGGGAPQLGPEFGEEGGLQIPATNTQGKGGQGYFDPNPGTEEISEPLSQTTKRLAREHQEFGAMVRELGYIIDRIEERPKESEVAKAMADAVRDHKGPLQVTLPAEGPRTTKTRKDFVLNETGMVTGVVETKVEE